MHVKKHERKQPRKRKNIVRWTKLNKIHPLAYYEQVARTVEEKALNKQFERINWKVKGRPQLTCKYGVIEDYENFGKRNWRIRVQNRIV